MKKDENTIVSKLSQVLEAFVELCKQCENLNPLSSGTRQIETECVDVCTWGARSIDLLNRVDIGIGEDHVVLSKLRQLEPGRLEDRKNAQQLMQMWGHALEELEKLKGAVPFCISLVDEKTKCSKRKKDRLDFRDKSLNLALNMLWELQDAFPLYGAKEYPPLRIQLILSHLRYFRNTFVWTAEARGPCCAYDLPDEWKNPDLPDVSEGELRVFHRQDSQDGHELTFCVGTRKPLEWHVDDTGLLNYAERLKQIWDRDTGRPRSSGYEGAAAWEVYHLDGIEKLEESADKICRLLRGLASMNKYKELAKSILEIVRNESGRWETCKVPWVYLKKLDWVIAKLKEMPKQHKISKSKPPGTEHNIKPPEKGGQSGGYKNEEKLLTQPTTLKSFIKIHCDLTAKPDVQSKVSLLHEYNRKSKIKLPKLAQRYKRGQHKYYYVDDLRKNWTTYQKEMPTLPPLRVPGK